MINPPIFTTGDISELVEDPKQLFDLGKCTFRGHILYDFIIILTTPDDEPIEINTGRNLILNMDEDEFSEFIANYVNEHEMYLANADYQGEGILRITPKTLNCRLYAGAPQEK